MKPKYITFASALLILACGLLSPGTPIPEPTKPISPPTTPPPTPTSPSSLFSDLGTILFRDDFDGSLGVGWEWTREDPSNWSLTTAPGSLQINVGPGQVNAEDNSNLLLRPIPSGNIQIETKVTFKPVANFQFAGLIIYESSSNFVQVGRAFCDEVSICVGDGFYMDYYEDGSFVAPNYAQPFTQGDTVYLQLIRRDETYTLQTSTDGENWTLRGTTTSNMNPLQIGLVAGQNTSSVIPAVFDYFEVTSLP